MVFQVAKEVKRNIPRERRILSLIGIFIIAVILLVFYIISNPSILEKKEIPLEDNQTGQTKVQEDTILNTNETINQTEQKPIINPLFNFEIKTAKEIDSKTCGSSPEDLERWFGKPYYSLHWENYPNGTKIGPKTQRFGLNDTLIYTTGQLNESTHIIQTVSILAREEINHTLIVNINC